MYQVSIEYCDYSYKCLIHDLHVTFMHRDSGFCINCLHFTHFGDDRTNVDSSVYFDFVEFRIGEVELVYIEWSCKFWDGAIINDRRDRVLVQFAIEDDLLIYHNTYYMYIDCSYECEMNE